MSYCGTFLAAGSSDFRVTIWTTADARHHKTLRGHKDAVYCVCFADECDIVASAAANGDVIIWDIENGCILSRLEQLCSKTFDGSVPYPAKFIKLLCVTREFCALHTSNDDIIIYHTDGGVLMEKPAYTTAMNTKVALSNAHSTLAWGRTPGEMMLWKLHDSHRRNMGLGQDRLDVVDVCFSTAHPLACTVAATDGIECNVLFVYQE
jgi:WD40 repeat protein